MATVTRSTVKDEQRRRILQATGELVGERGYAEVTIELIVKRSRVSFKTFYKHYGSKERVFEALCERTYETSETVIRERLRPPAPWPDQVVIALRSFVELVSSDPLLARAVLVESPSVGRTFRERQQRATNGLRRLLHRGRQMTGRGAALPDRIEDILVGSVLWSAYEQLLVDNGADLSASLPAMLELVLGTYLDGDLARSIAKTEEKEDRFTAV